MFCIFHPSSLNVYIHPENTMKQLLSSGKCHIHAQVYPCHQAWGCILRAQEIGYSVVFFSLWTIPSLLFTSCPPLSATHQFTTSFHVSGAPKGLKALLIKCNVFQNMKEHDIYRQQVIKTMYQTHRVPPLQPCKDPSKIIFPALWSGLPELPDLLWYRQGKEQEIRLPSTLSSCWNHAAVEPKDQDSPPLAADPISMVTAGTDFYDSASLKHFPQELSGPKSQCSMLRKHPWLPRTASQYSQFSGTSQP